MLKNWRWLQCSYHCHSNLLPFLIANPVCGNKVEARQVVIIYQLQVLPSRIAGLAL